MRCKSGVLGFSAVLAAIVLLAGPVQLYLRCGPDVRSPDSTQAPSAGWRPPATARMTPESRERQVAVGRHFPGGAATYANFELRDQITLARNGGQLEDRLDAIADLGDSQDPLAAAVLRSLLDDPQPAVREETLEALRAIGGEEGVAGLGYALSDGDARVRRLAIELLGEIGSDAAVAALAGALNEQDLRIRRLAAEELRDIDSVPARNLLQRFTADWPVRQGADDAAGSREVLAE